MDASGGKEREEREGEEEEEDAYDCRVTKLKVGGPFSQQLYLVSAGSNGIVRVWSLPPPTVHNEYGQAIQIGGFDHYVVKDLANGHTEGDPIYDLAFTQKHLISCSRDGTICFWHLRSFDLVNKLFISFPEHPRSLYVQESPAAGLFEPKVVKREIVQEEEKEESILPPIDRHRGNEEDEEEKKEEEEKEEDK